MRSVIQSVHRAHYGIWMNIPNPSGHGLRLWLSHRGAEGFQLAVDIGEKLGTGAYCENLRRTKIADYSIDQAKTLADFGITS